MDRDPKQWSDIGATRIGEVFEPTRVNEFPTSLFDVIPGQSLGIAWVVLVALTIGWFWLRGLEFGVMPF